GAYQGDRNRNVGHCRHWPEGIHDQMSTTINRPTQMRCRGPGTTAFPRSDSFLNSGTQGGPRSYLGSLLAYYMMRNSEARRATKAALAGLRSGSIRSAGCRNGYDCTARIEHLSLPEPATRGFLAAVRPALSLLRLPKRSASTFLRRCSPAPTRG